MALLNSTKFFCRGCSAAAIACAAALGLALGAQAADGARVSASDTAERFKADGAVEGNRFSVEPSAAWKGRSGARGWWWQIQFEEARPIGAILQVQGDHEFVLRNAPRHSLWQSSDDGAIWHDLPETAITQERRVFRIHRLNKAITARFLRLNIAAVSGEFPTLREVEFYSDPQARIAFPDWIVVVNTTHDPTLPGHGQEFIPLAKSCAGESELEAQQIWIETFTEDFLRVEPRPLGGFLSGNFKDWCQVNRETWRGAQEVLRAKNLPLWASCGGAQGLALLAETGVDRPWDCPHCRDPRQPGTPIYTHLGHTAPRPCGDYTGCLFERGPHWVRPLTGDPVFKNLPGEFRVMESHCGQIEWPPAGWSLIATAGPGTQTKTQCLRLNDRYIYAAQFHVEMKGTPEASRQIMQNFLTLAKSWGGYNPNGAAVAAPGSKASR